MFNPFDLKWNGIYCGIFNIPMKMLPEVRDTNGFFFGDVDPELFGAPDSPYAPRLATSSPRCSVTDVIIPEM